MERRTEGIPIHRLHEGCALTLRITQQGRSRTSLTARGEAREVVLPQRSNLVNGRKESLTGHTDG
eukprot:2297784-Amphidinium_carterae.1